MAWNNYCKSGLSIVVNIVCHYRRHEVHGYSKPSDNRAEIKPKALSNITAISVGFSNTCTLISGGEVKCWGYVPLGDGTTAGSAIPLDVVLVRYTYSVSTC
jgi:hypothetical protein